MTGGVRRRVWIGLAGPALAMGLALSCQSPEGREKAAAPASRAVVLRSKDSPEAMVRKAVQVVPDSRQRVWQEREFIGFIHFGTNTFTGREWGLGNEDPAVFNPVDFDARQWVKVFRDAGMKMLILTAKHHDGLCLWPSRFTDHSVKKSPWKDGRGDVVREAADACRECGLDFGVYLSPWDRHEPSFGDSPRYNAHFIGQLRELLTRYGKISEVWFDGANAEGPNGKRQVYDWPAYYAVVRDLAPDAVIFGMGPDVRWVGTESGYGRETEWSVMPVSIRDSTNIPDRPDAAWIDNNFLPGDMMAPDLGSRLQFKPETMLLWYPSEADVSIRPGWFYHEAQDTRVKTPENLVDIYYASVGRNSVLLLNVPPDRRGRLHENDTASLLGMRKILDRTFACNLAADARIRAENQGPENGPEAVLDSDASTFWAASEGAVSSRLEFEFNAPVTFDVAMLQEPIAFGQRIERFRLDALDNGSWKTFAEGTTIGYKRLLRFPKTTAKSLRLVIEQSRSHPMISEFGLFRLPPAGEKIP